MKKIIRKLLEKIVLDDIYKIIYDLGGCDAKDNYARGWDDGVNAIEYELQKLIERKFNR